MPVTERITYFNDPGAWQENTEACIEIVKQAVERGAARHVVVASSTGRTAAAFARQLDLSRVSLVGVKMAQAVDRRYSVSPDEAACAHLAERGVPLVGGVHALTGGVDVALAERFGGVSPNQLIANTLYLFSQGMKVAVEVVLMAHDHGLLPDAAPVLAAGGTGQGCDTVVLAKSAGSSRLFDLRVLKVLAMPLECGMG